MCNMSSTFLNVINFGMLRLLRLHQLNIQFSLETLNEDTDIFCPNMQAHKAKLRNMTEFISLMHLTLFVTTILHANHDALDSLKNLGKALK